MNAKNLIKSLVESSSKVSSGDTFIVKRVVPIDSNHWHVRVDGRSRTNREIVFSADPRDVKREGIQSGDHITIDRMDFRRYENRYSIKASYSRYEDEYDLESDVTTGTINLTMSI